MSSAVILQHVAHEGAGRIIPILRDFGIPVQIRRLHQGDEVPTDLDELRLLIVLGGSMSVSDIGNSQYPFLAQEVEVLKRLIATDRPVLGICLGAQMLARVLGARVFPGPKELGWAPLILTPEGETSVVAPVGPDSTSMLHWHGDTFDLPPKATLLASTEQVAHQVFSWERFVLAFQCHPEVRHEDIESWLIGHASEIAAASGASVEQLRKDTQYYGPTLTACAKTVFTEWLESVGL